MNSELRIDISRDDLTARWRGTPRQTADYWTILGEFGGIILVGNGLEQVSAYVPGQRLVPDFSNIDKAVRVHEFDESTFCVLSKECATVEVPVKSIMVHSFRDIHQFVVPYAFFEGRWYVGQVQQAVNPKVK